MKQSERSQIRNIGTFGHGGEGKTSLVEAILFDTGENTRLGRVDDGYSIMDFEQEEINRKISISASLGHFEWDKHHFNVLDTPGYANFIAEARQHEVVDGRHRGGEVRSEADSVWDMPTFRSHPLCRQDGGTGRSPKVVEDAKKHPPKIIAGRAISKAGFKGVF
jgi:hypothetical protein